MKALVLTDYKKLNYMEVPDPKITDTHDVLIRIKAAAICGSDVHGFDGSTGRRKPPIIMGHEASGEVIECGKNVTAFKAGDRVTFDSTIYCGTCRFCRIGQINLCDNRRVLGVSCDEYRKDGIFAEYVVVPDYIVYKIPEQLDYLQASLTEPAAVAAHAVSLTPLALNNTAAVVGTGVIGLLIIKILRVSCSGTIFALDTDENRRKTALEYGADYAFDPVDPQLLKKVCNATGGLMTDCAFEAVGATSPIATALSLVRKGGFVTLVGNVSPSINLPLQQVVTRQITLRGSCAIAGEYPAVINMLGRGKLDVKPIISASAPLSEGQKWFDRLYAREAGLLKVVLIP